MSRTPKLALLLTLALAAALRIYGIGFGETNARARPDEEIFLDQAFDLFDDNHHDVEILPTGFPEGYQRFENALLRLEGEVLSSRFGREVNLGCVYALRPSTVSLPIRFTSVFFDLLTCLLLAWLVGAMFPDARGLASVLGSLAFGCNYLAARNGHFAVTDAVSTLLFTLALVLCVQAVRRGPAFLPLAALATGLGFGVKYSAAALGPPCLVAGVVCLAVFPRKGRTLLFGLLSLATGVAGLLFASPGIARVPKAFWEGLHSHTYRFGDGARAHLIDASYVIPPGWRFHLFTNLPIAFGKIGLVLATAGLLVAFARNRREGLVLWAALLGVFAMVLPTTAQFVRYITPAVPVLAVGLAVALTATVDFLTDVAPGLVGWTASLGVIAGALVPPVITTLQFDRLLAAGDTRDVATYWLMEHGGGPAVTQGGWFEETRLLGQKAASACLATLPAELATPAPLLPPDPSNWDRALGDGRKGWGFIAREATDHYHNVGSGLRTQARYLLVGRGLLPCGREAKLEYSPEFEHDCFVLRDVISPGELSCDSVMDLFDAYYVPYGRFEGQVLVGPRIEIYENVCLK